MHNMKKTVLSVALLALIGTPAAMAQSSAGSGASKSGGVALAPIGHRQPRVSDLPSEKGLSDPNNPANKEDAILDKKIKSICRGC